MGAQTPPVRPLNRTSLLFLFQKSEPATKNLMSEQSATSDYFPLFQMEDSN